MKFAEDAGIDDGDFESEGTEMDPTAFLECGIWQIAWGGIGMKVYGFRNGYNLN